MSKDALGDRMKQYERAETGKFMPKLPICVRLDGKNFSKYTKGMNRPYDYNMSSIMQETTKFLVEQTHAVIGYTQSDEITLIYYSDKIDSEVFFNGKKQKMVSVLASMCTAKFNELAKVLFPGKPLAFFDCRVWQVPTLYEAVNVLVWREQDAVKNSITMACQEFYSHKELHGKHQADQHEMLHEKGVNWDNYPDFFKRGSYFGRRKMLTKFTGTEIEKLPPKHEARTNPDLKIERTKLIELHLPILTKIANAVEVIFEGEDVKMKTTYKNNA